MHFRNLTLGSALKRRIRAVSAAYTLTLQDDDILLVDTTAASRIITLPPVAEAYDAQRGVGKTYLVIKTIAANSVTVDGNAAETINGSANQALTTQYSSAVFTAGPTEWHMHATALIDAATLAAGTITSTMILDGTIATADIGASQITNALMADNAIDSAELVAGSVDLAHMSANSIDSDQYVDGSIDAEHFAAGAVNVTALGTGAVSPVKVLDTAVTPAADAAAAILNTTTEMNLTVTAAGNVAISTTSSVAGQKVALHAVAVAGGGSYTLALVSGTLTLNSTGETAYIKRNQANTGWRVLSLAPGAAGGAAATIV